MTPTWTIALAPLSPRPTITQRPCPTGVIVQVGLAPLVFTIPVQSPCRVNGPLKPCWTNVIGAGVEAVTLVNWMFRGVTPPGTVCCPAADELGAALSARGGRRRDRSRSFEAGLPAG